MDHLAHHPGGIEQGVSLENIVIAALVEQDLMFEGVEVD